MTQRRRPDSVVLATIACPVNRDHASRSAAIAVGSDEQTPTRSPACVARNTDSSSNRRPDAKVRPAASMSTRVRSGGSGIDAYSVAGGELIMNGAATDPAGRGLAVARLAIGAMFVYVFFEN